MQQGQDNERSVQEIASDLGGAVTELYDRVELGRHLQENPYRTLALAAGVGYILGGGLFTPLTGSLFRVGMRAMILPLLQQTLEGVGQPDDGSPYY